jgi:hypothetical protein
MSVGYPLPGSSESEGETNRLFADMLRKPRE